MRAGPLPLPNIAGLLLGIRFVRAHLAEIREYEDALNRRLPGRGWSISPEFVAWDIPMRRG